MNNPKLIERISDHEIFVRNDDGTYSNRVLLEAFPDHLHQKWSYSELMNGWGDFRPIQEEQSK